MEFLVTGNLSSVKLFHNASLFNADLSDQGKVIQQPPQQSVSVSTNAGLAQSILDFLIIVAKTGQEGREVHCNLV